MENNVYKKRRQKVSPGDDDPRQSLSTGLDLEEGNVNDNNDTDANNKDTNKKRDNRTKNLLNKFKTVINDTGDKAKAFKLIVNLKSGARKWKDYTTSRRTLRAAVAKVDHVDGVEQSIPNLAGGRGTGLSQIHEDFLLDKTKSKMSVESNRALINYFADLGRQRDENASINLEFVDTLLQGGAQIDCTDKHGQCVLHEVARAWHTDVAKYLIDHGADINQADNFGRTSLHVAAAVDYPEMVTVLIQNGADKEARTNEELQTAVHYAAKNDACLSLNALVENGCEYKLVRDFKLRTPIHLAAELDRSETAHLLLELGAPVGVADDSNQKAITWMIAKMPAVAKDALSEFHSTDRAKRKQYYRLDLLVQREEGKNNKYEETFAQSPLQVAVNNRQLDLLTHRVFMKLISVHWRRFGRLAAWQSLLTNFFFILLWTLMATIIEYDKKYKYDLPDHWWRIVLFAITIAFTAYYIIDEIVEYVKSLRSHLRWKEWREKEIQRDMKFCHPCWPEEKSFLEQELDFLDNTKPKYFRDLWNAFDWICYFLVLASIITHIVDICAHTDMAARTHIRVMCVTVILLWMRLLKNARAFELVGPFIVIAGHMLYDVLRFVFLYMEFYIPFVCAFWMIFGGTQNVEYPSQGLTTVDVKGFKNIGEVFFSLFRLTLVDEYDYDNMKLVDSVMADLLLGFWFALSAILCLNLFIALLSDTFQRVYDNAQANAIMQKTITILSWWDTMSHRRKSKFFRYIELNCAPVTEYYDDDVSTGDDYDLQKVTIQIKRDLTDFVERYDNDRVAESSLSSSSLKTSSSTASTVPLSKFESETRALRESMKALQTRQDDMMDRMKKEMRTVRALLEELTGSIPINLSHDRTDIERLALTQSEPAYHTDQNTNALSSQLPGQLPQPTEFLTNIDKSHKSRRKSKHRHKKDDTQSASDSHSRRATGFLSMDLAGPTPSVYSPTPIDTPNITTDTTRLIASQPTPRLLVSSMAEVQDTSVQETGPTFPEIRLRTDFDNAAYEKDYHSGSHA